MGKLYFRHGAMNSGKSTVLIQAAHNYEERDQKVLVAKPAIDSKGTDTVVSRLGESLTRIGRIAAPSTFSPPGDVAAVATGAEGPPAGVSPVTMTSIGCVRAVSYRLVAGSK